VRRARWQGVPAGALAATRDARVTAVEIAAHRARLIEQAVVGLPVDVVCADGRDVGVGDALPAGGFDRVLVDAPCTGLDRCGVAPSPGGAASPATCRR
jgi:16S rRNA (cytosine967-C5)-methyltransferase